MNGSLVSLDRRQRKEQEVGVGRVLQPEPGVLQLPGRLVTGSMVELSGLYAKRRMASAHCGADR